MKFLSSEVALYLYISTIHSFMEYCCHVWAGASSCYLELLDKLQKWICRTVGPVEPLAHHWNVASLSLFYKYYFGRCSSELAQLVPLPREGVLLIIAIDSMIFLSPFLDVTKMSVNSFFPCTARLWNSLPIECFPLTCGFKARVNRNLFTVDSF